MKNIFLILLLFTATAYGQTYPGQVANNYFITGALSVGQGAANLIANSNAWLQIGKDSTKKAIILPRAIKDSVPGVKGMAIFNLQDSTLYTYSGLTWERYLKLKDTALVKSIIQNSLLTEYYTIDEIDAGFEPLLGYTPVPDTRTVNGHALTANVTVSKSDVGLGNADNTSDANKPVSTAQQAALDLKVPTSRTINSLPLSSNITLNTDNINEGSTNQYYTNARSRGALSAGTGISYNSSTGVITNSGTLQTTTNNGATTTNAVTINENSLGGTLTPAVTVANNTAAVNGTQQISPALVLVGQGFSTTGGVSTTIKWYVAAVPVQNTTATSYLGFYQQVGAGGITEIMRITKDASGQSQINFPSGGNTLPNIVDIGSGNMQLNAGILRFGGNNGMSFAGSGGTIHSIIAPSTNDLVWGGTSDQGWKVDIQSSGTAGYFRTGSIENTGFFKVTTGTNKSMGTATLSSGTVTVNNTLVTANTIVRVQLKTPGGTACGVQYKYTVSAGTSFTITSIKADQTTETNDNSTVDWWIVN